MSAEIRQLAGGESITTETLRDFLQSVLCHDAIRDALAERAVAAVEGAFPLDEFRVRVLATELQVLIAEVVSAAEPEDWRALAEALIEETRETLDRGGDLP